MPHLPLPVPRIHLPGKHASKQLITSSIHPSFLSFTLQKLIIRPASALLLLAIDQCKNGHVVCDACSVRIHGTCPSCREPVVGDIRCRALENAIAGMALPCAFSSHGCTRLLKHGERRHHEASLCLHAPFACPLQGCAYSGQLLYDHIHDAHAFFLDCVVLCFAVAGSAWRVSLRRSTPFMVLLDAVDRRVFLLLNGGDVRSGRSLSVVCLGPRPMADQLLEYKLEVGGGAGGQPGVLSLSACSMPCMRSWAGQQHTPDGFLFVPDAYWTSLHSVVVVNVHVQKSTVNNADRSPSTFVALLVLAVFVFSTMAVMLALAWKTSASATPSVPVPDKSLWDTTYQIFLTFTKFVENACNIYKFK